MKHTVLTILLLASAAALADTSRAHIKALDEDLHRLTRQLQAIDARQDGQGVAAHLQGLETHLQSTRREICGDCASDDVTTSEFGRKADACGGAVRVTSAMPADEYAALMHRELPRLHDKLYRLKRERYLFEPRTVHERPRLLREYYDLVRSTIDATQPKCSNAPEARTIRSGT